VQPKWLYRELEKLLHEREKDTLSRAWFNWLMGEIVSRLGDTLFIDSARTYESDGERFLIDYSVSPRWSEQVGLEVPLTYRPVQLVLEHQVFVFDSSVEGQSEELEGRLGGLESAAILVDSVPQRILAFGLKPGWERDDLDFALNTLQNAINLRVQVHGLQTDIEQAAEIQQSLLPTKFPELPGFDIAARSISAEKVGGDFYDFLDWNSESAVVAVGDASGHGLGAALLARDTVTGIRMGAERFLKITEIMRRLNRVISRSALSSRFVSLFYADLESNGDVFYVNAGHPAPWLLSDDETQRLEVGGTIMGPLDSQTFRRGWAHIGHGDVLIIATDGLIERMNVTGDMFEDEGIEAVARGLKGRTAEEILDGVFSAAKEFGGNRPWADDTTAVVIVRSVN
jgi:sigma-B regulation protein RsbU (phosphoserine phosphatase)